jgi:hypothetical protein
MKLVLAASEVKAVTTKLEEASQLIPGIELDKIFKGSNITWTDFIAAIALNQPLTIEINEDDLARILEMYGDLVLDSIAPAFAIIRNAQRFQKKIEAFKPTPEPPTVWIGLRLIAKVKEAFTAKED